MTRSARGLCATAELLVLKKCLMCACIAARYNHRIKTFMRDVNAVKTASADTTRMSSYFNRAVESFWPDKVTDMKTLLLDTPDGPDSTALKSRSRYERFVSFRCLVIGAVCVWQECWNLLQTCKRKTVDEQSYIGELTDSMERLKTDLIPVIEKRRYREVVLCVFSLQSAYLYLQAKRLSCFIKNPVLLHILNNICIYFRDPLTHYTSVAYLISANSALTSNFRLYQRDNIVDFLRHLEDYFQPKMKDTLETKTWLVCEQGKQYVFFSMLSFEYKCQYPAASLGFGPAAKARGIQYIDENPILFWAGVEFLLPTAVKPGYASANSQHLA